MRLSLDADRGLDLAKLGADAAGKFQRTTWAQCAVVDGNMMTAQVLPTWLSDMLAISWSCRTAYCSKCTR